MENSEKKSYDLWILVTKGSSCHISILFASFTMKAIFSGKKANVISLLLSGYSLRKVESIIGLEK